ncbi:PMD domain-containing protein [Abeliophyllum distichum]|uniref:PMD domain-containing protein n=1 Tax=Abeliophyllum distichum TaxID=126358 RepID=A0ABD1V2K4_9LAMI
MAQSNSKSKENLKLPEITELNDTARKGKILCFPKTIVKYHSHTNATGELKLTIHMSMPCPSTSCVPLKELHMHILSSRQRNLDAFQHPSLGPPPHHSQDMKIIPRAIISERINQRKIKWESALSSRGEASYLSKFWEWSVWIHKLLVKRNLPDLASAVYSATKDYSRPNSVYRALCEVWCPDTNTFITTNGEIGISLWDIREITGLSIRGDYYEELIRRKQIEFAMPIGLSFGSKKMIVFPNPRKSKPFKKAMESKPRKEGQRTVKDRIRRPVVTDRPKETLCRDRSHWNSYLSVDEEEELEIAAYLSLWLCRFIFLPETTISESGLSKQLLEWLPSRLTV